MSAPPVCDIPQDILDQSQAVLDHAFKYDLPMVEVLGRQIVLERERIAALLQDPAAVRINILNGSIKLPKFYVEVPPGKAVMFADMDGPGNFGTAINQVEA